MKIDNFYYLSYYFDNLTTDEFLFVTIIQRKKDGHSELSNNNDGYRTIKMFTISSLTELMSYKKTIVELCTKLKARAYVNVEKRNYKEIALYCATDFIDLIRNNNSKNIMKVVQSCCSKYRARGATKYFTLDIDSKNGDLLTKAISMVTECGGVVQTILNTVNGYHVICTVFNREQFEQLIHMYSVEDVTVKVNSPVLLYYNKL